MGHSVSYGPICVPIRLRLIKPRRLMEREGLPVSTRIIPLRNSGSKAIFRISPAAIPGQMQRRNLTTSVATKTMAALPLPKAGERLPKRRLVLRSFSEALDRGAACTSRPRLGVCQMNGCLLLRLSPIRWRGSLRHRGALAACVARRLRREPRPCGRTRPLSSGRCCGPGVPRPS